MWGAALAATLLVGAPTADELRAASAEAFGARRYADADELLRQAYALDPDPQLVYGRAQVQRSWGHCGEAVEFYESFIQLSDAPKAQADAQSWIDECADVLDAIATATQQAEAGNVDAGRRTLAALGPDPASPEVILARASVELEGGDCAAARSLVDLFVERVGDDARAEAAAERVALCEEPLPAAEPPPPRIESEPPPPIDRAAPIEKKRRLDGWTIGLTVSGATVAVVGGALIGAGHARARRDAADEGVFDENVNVSRSLYWSGIAGVSVGAGLLATAAVRALWLRSRKK